MKDWTDIIGEQLGTMGEPLPADDWKVLQQKHSSLKRARKVAAWRWTGSIAAAAAVLLIFFIFQQDENTPSVNLMAEEIAPTEEILPVKEILPHSSSADPHRIPVIPDNSSVAPDNTPVASDNSSVASGSSSAGTGNCTAVAKKDSDAAAAVQIASGSSQNETSEESQLRDTTLLADELPDELPEETRRNKRIRPVSISFSGAVPTPTQSVNETSYGAMVPADTIPQNGKIPIKALPQNSNYDIYDHKMPISVGLSARYFINDILAINSGINYTRYESERRKNPSINRESSTQKVHYVGIPVRFDLIIANRKGFSLYAGAGMQADKCIWATAWGERLREKEVIWSVTCAAGLQLNITPTASIYLEPEFSRTLNTGSLQTYRTEEKSIRYLRAGVRFTL